MTPMILPLRCACGSEGPWFPRPDMTRWIRQLKRELGISGRTEPQHHCVKCGTDAAMRKAGAA